MSPPAPELSVVVLCWNSRRFLPDLLDSLQAQRYRDFELLVVDNGSTDGTAEWLRENAPQARLLQSRRNRGYCRGMNRGARAARGRWLLLLNADLRLDPECLAVLMRVGRADLKGLAGVFPKVLFMDAPLFVNSFGVDWHERAHWRDARVGLFHRLGARHPERTFGAIFPAVLIRAEAFHRAGRFDPLFHTYNEDFDLCYRINSMGLRWYTAPEAILYHHYRASIPDPRAARRHQRRFVRNYLAVFLKNYEWSSLRAQWLYILYRYVGAPVRIALRQRRWGDALAVLGGLVEFLLRVPPWLWKRRAVQRRRTVQDHELWSFAPIEEFNLFHYNGDLVMSLLNLRASGGEPVTYQADGVEYVTE